MALDVRASGAPVRALERLDHIAERQAVRLEQGRIELELVGPKLAAERVDLDDPGHALQLR